MTVTEEVSTSVVRCPFCRHGHDPSSDLDCAAYDEDFDEMECHACGRLFDVLTKVEWIWRTTAPT